MAICIHYLSQLQSRAVFYGSLFDNLNSLFNSCKCCRSPTGAGKIYLIKKRKRKKLHPSVVLLFFNRFKTAALMFLPAALTDIKVVLLAMQLRQENEERQKSCC